MGFLSRVTILLTHIRRRIAPAIATHQPPSIKKAKLAGRPGGADAAFGSAGWSLGLGF